MEKLHQKNEILNERCDDMDWGNKKFRSSRDVRGGMQFIVLTEETFELS